MSLYIVFPESESVYLRLYNKYIMPPSLVSKYNSQLNKVALSNQGRIL